MRLGSCFRGWPETSLATRKVGLVGHCQSARTRIIHAPVDTRARAPNRARMSPAGFCAAGLPWHDSHPKGPGTNIVRILGFNTGNY